MTSDEILDMYVTKRGVYQLDTTTFRRKMKNGFVGEFVNDIANKLRMWQKEKLIQENQFAFSRYIAHQFKVEVLNIPCGKYIFTEQSSMKALQSALLSTSAKRREKRRYYCKFCRGWHLTSQGKPEKKV